MDLVRYRVFFSSIPCINQLQLVRKILYHVSTNRTWYRFFRLVHVDTGFVPTSNYLYEHLHFRSDLESHFELVGSTCHV